MGLLAKRKTASLVAPVTFPVAAALLAARDPAVPVTNRLLAGLVTLNISARTDMVQGRTATIGGALARAMRAQDSHLTFLAQDVNNKWTFVLGVPSRRGGQVIDWTQVLRVGKAEGRIDTTAYRTTNGALSNPDLHGELRGLCARVLASEATPPADTSVAIYAGSHATLTAAECQSGWHSAAESVTSSISRDLDLGGLVLDIADPGSSERTAALLVSLSLENNKQPMPIWKVIATYEGGVAKLSPFILRFSVDGIVQRAALERVLQAFLTALEIRWSRPLD